MWTGEVYPSQVSIDVPTTPLDIPNYYRHLTLRQYERVLFNVCA